MLVVSLDTGEALPSTLTKTVFHFHRWRLFIIVFMCMNRLERCMNPLNQQLISLLSPSMLLLSRSSLLRVQRSTVGGLKRKDVFIEPRPVRCVWSLMSPVTFMWHSIKDREADKLFNKLTCLARGLTVMWQQDCSSTEGICCLEWCEDESDTLHHFKPTELWTGENHLCFFTEKCQLLWPVVVYFFKTRVT